MGKGSPTSTGLVNRQDKRTILGGGRRIKVEEKSLLTTLTKFTIDRCRSSPNSPRRKKKKKKKKKIRIGKLEQGRQQSRRGNRTFWEQIRRGATELGANATGLHSNMFGVPSSMEDF